MSLDLPVFDRKNLKRAYYFFLALNVIIAVASILGLAILADQINHKLLNTINTWVIFLILFIASYIFSKKSKKELKSILETHDYEHQFLKYEGYYKKRLAWNAFSLVVSGAFFIVTNKNAFFYLLVIQLILSLMVYPSKTLLSKELNNREIIFT